MAKYRKKPVEIEAIQYVDDSGVLDSIAEFVGKDIGVDYSQTPPLLKIYTLEGTMTAQPGDYIIKGVQGECYPCKPDIFEKTYEEVSISDQLLLANDPYA